ncbi:DUF294 nucleotidyltransferase-like domain-containing protein [Anaerobacillus sp. MEB173]|uniref:DUF294 nucleotidyltransferase-like domain-containing protein n=1 Tax=Anaerobacillus sp. MEB173 TaxID=3383345 RepID=UPI003F915C08
MGLIHPLSKAIINRYSTYHELIEWRRQNISKVALIHEKLNEFHDMLIQRAVEVAVRKIESERGPAPARFTFFMMGSAARFEQSVWSDQDHGMIYGQCDDEGKQYFQSLGEEITFGLTQVGYEPCDGKVMSSNPKWCKSLNEWKEQLKGWMEEESWESIRYLLTFFDSRSFLGEEHFLKELKDLIFSHIDEHPYLMRRMLENVGHTRRGIGVFGQFLVETHGKHSGCIHVKNRILFPYVNSLRLLALKEKIEQPQTVLRFDELPSYYQQIKKYKPAFSKLLSLRLKFQQHEESYETIHYLKVSHLSHQEKKDLKDITRSGYKLYQETKKLIEKGCPKWS